MLKCSGNQNKTVLLLLLLLLLLIGVAVFIYKVKSKARARARTRNPIYENVENEKEAEDKNPQPDMWSIFKCLHMTDVEKSEISVIFKKIMCAIYGVLLQSHFFAIYEYIFCLNDLPEPFNFSCTCFLQRYLKKISVWWKQTEHMTKFL